MSISSGLLITPLTATVTSDDGEGDAGAVSGLMNITKQVGGAICLAGPVVVAHTTFSNPRALVDGYSNAFLTMAPILIVVTIITLVIPTFRDEPAEALQLHGDERHEPVPGN